MDQPACVITRYDCPKDQEKINELVKLAKAQQAKGQFESIFPWDQGCNVTRHYVAQKADGTICGWMAIVERASSSRQNAKYTYIYLSEISVIRVRDDSFRGVGKRLHDALVADATKDNKDFIYLNPLNADVEKTYIEKWGYEKLGKRALFYLLKKDLKIPNRLVEKLNPETYPRSFMPTARQILAGDKEALAVVENRDLRQNVLQDPASLTNLEEAVNLYAMYETLTEEDVPEDAIQEVRDMIVNVYKAAPPAVLHSLKGGRKKTRRRRHPLRTRRLHRKH